MYPPYLTPFPNPTDALIWYVPVMHPFIRRIVHTFSTERWELWICSYAVRCCVPLNWISLWEFCHNVCSQCWFFNHPSIQHLAYQIAVSVEGESNRAGVETLSGLSTKFSIALCSASEPDSENKSTPLILDVILQRSDLSESTENLSSWPTCKVEKSRFGVDSVTYFSISAFFFSPIKWEIVMCLSTSTPSLELKLHLKHLMNKSGKSISARPIMCCRVICLLMKFLLVEKNLHLKQWKGMRFSASCILAFDLDNII